MQTYDTHKGKTEVRQADRSHLNMRVLLISLTALVVLFGLIYFVFFAAAPPVSQQL